MEVYLDSTAYTATHVTPGNSHLIFTKVIDSLSGATSGRGTCSNITAEQFLNLWKNQMCFLCSKCLSYFLIVPCTLAGCQVFNHLSAIPPVQFYNSIYFAINLSPHPHAGEISPISKVARVMGMRASQRVCKMKQDRYR